MATKGVKNVPRVIAKIEKPEALEDIDAIIREADGIMVARGDLGVEVPLEQVPLIQKMLAKKMYGGIKTNHYCHANDGRYDHKYSSHTRRS